MSAITLQDVVLTIIQVIVLLVIIILSSRIMVKGDRGVLPAFFTFAMVSFLLSDIYYINYNILRPDTRMPFAVNEIAECAMMLLLSAGLETEADRRGKNVPADILIPVVFIGANIALWIAWSGEWIQDIVFGIPYMYLMFLLVRGLRRTGAMNAAEAASVLTAGMLEIILQVLIILFPDRLGGQYLLTGYILMYIVTAWLMYKSIRALKVKDGRDNALYLTITLFLWTLIVLYASEGVYYSIAMGLNIITLPIMYLSAAKRSVTNDIC